MTIPITGQPPVPSLSEPDTFNTKALNLFTWQTGSMLDQFNNVDPNDFFDIPALTAAAAQSQTKNAIINGAFDVWQRGDTTSVHLGFGADRWQNRFSGGTSEQGRISIGGSVTLGSNEISNYLYQIVTGQSGSNDHSMIAQNMENVRTFAGKTVTVLGWTRLVSGSGSNIAVGFQQSFGTGGSSDNISITSVTVPLVAGWAPFAATINIPSVAGKTIATDGTDLLRLQFWISAGSSFNARTNSLGIQSPSVGLWGIHILQGTHGVEACDNYIAPRVVDELPRCQRYGYAFVPKGAPAFKLVGIAHGQNSTNTLNVSLSTVMRAAPSMEYGGEYRLYNIGGPAGNTTTLTLTDPNPNTVSISAVAGTFVNNAAMTFKTNTADCFIFLDAEL